MKKILLGALAITASLFVTGCYDDYDHHLTSEEDSMVRAYTKQHDASHYDYIATLKAIKWDNTKDKDREPFCGYIGTIKSTEVTLKPYNDNKTLSAIIIKVKGAPLGSHCPDFEHTVEIESTDTETSGPTIEDKKLSLIDIQLYDEVINASKGCRRAENKVLELTETQQGITSENYTEIMKAVLRCKALELENEVNTK